MKQIKVNLNHYRLEPKFRKKIGKMMCRDEAQVWADNYIDNYLLQGTYDLDLSKYKALPYCIQRLVRIKLKEVYRIQIS